MSARPEHRNHVGHTDTTPGAACPGRANKECKA
jgi:hypothetical protein